MLLYFTKAAQDFKSMFSIPNTFPSVSLGTGSESDFFVYLTYNQKRFEPHQLLNNSFSSTASLHLVQGEKLQPYEEFGVCNMYQKISWSNFIGLIKGKNFPMLRSFMNYK